jgi:hypothetical protein
MTWPGLTQDVEHVLFMFHLSSMSNDKEGAKSKKYGLLPPKIAEYDTVTLGHGMFGSGGSHPFTIRIPTKTHSLLIFTIIDPDTGWFEIVKATNKSATSIQDLFHNTWLARYPRPQFIVVDNGKEGKFKREVKQMCDNYGIKSKQTTTHNHQFTSKCNH